MSYKIAVGSSDGVNIDLKFGQIEKFLIFEIDENIVLKEERFFDLSRETDCNAGCGGGGCSGRGGGCSGPEEVSAKVELIKDCRAIVAKKIGFQAQKQLEKRAIAVFDVEYTIEEALTKISNYYSKIDKGEKFVRV